MRISYYSILETIKKEAIEQTSQKLSKQGFNTTKDYHYSNHVIDLFAQRDNEKRLYEFKVSKSAINKSSKERERYAVLQQIAKRLDAKLLYIFVKPPKDGVSVSIEGFEEKLFDDIFEKGKDILTKMSFVSPTIQDVYDIQFKVVALYENNILVTGRCFADVEILNVSEIEFAKNLNLNSLENRDILVDFEIRMDKTLNILDSEYRFITEN